MTKDCLNRRARLHYHSPKSCRETMEKLQRSFEGAHMPSVGDMELLDDPRLDLPEVIRPRLI